MNDVEIGLVRHFCNILEKKDRLIPMFVAYYYQDLTGLTHPFIEKMRVFRFISIKNQLQR